MHGLLGDVSCDETLAVPVLDHQAKELGDLDVSVCKRFVVSVPQRCTSLAATTINVRATL